MTIPAVENTVILKERKKKVFCCNLSVTVTSKSAVQDNRCLCIRSNSSLLSDSAHPEMKFWSLRTHVVTKTTGHLQCCEFEGYSFYKVINTCIIFVPPKHCFEVQLEMYFFKLYSEIELLPYNTKLENNLTSLPPHIKLLQVRMFL